MYAKEEERERMNSKKKIGIRKPDFMKNKDSAKFITIIFFNLQLFTFILDYIKKIKVYWKKKKTLKQCISI